MTMDLIQHNNFNELIVGEKAARAVSVGVAGSGDDWLVMVVMAQGGGCYRTC